MNKCMGMLAYRRIIAVIIENSDCSSEISMIIKRYATTLFSICTEPKPNR